MSTKDQYRIERLTKEKLSDVCFLFEANNKQRHSLDYFEKKFDTSYTGISYIGYIAYNIARNEPAAVYIVYPCFIEHKKKNILSAQSGDTITNPKDQKKGLFVLLARQTYELADKEGIKIIFGFPNDQSQHAFFNKLNWLKSPPLNTYNVNTYAIPFFKILKKFQLLNPVYHPYLKKLSKLFPASGKILLLSNEDENTSKVLKDNNYRAYKNYEKSYILKLENTTIWFKPGESIRIGLIYMDSSTNPNQLISKLKLLSFLIGISKISITITTNSYYDKLLKQYYVPALTVENVGYLTLDKEIGEIRLNHTEADFDTF